MSQRADLLATVAGLVPAGVGDDCVRVGIDGGDGAGKTVFADELAVALRRAGRAVVRVSVDDFHLPRAVRYRRGPTSPSGFWLDSFDYARLWRDVLLPLGPSGSRVYRTASHDLGTDLPVSRSPLGAARCSVVVVDGLCLHRAELAGAWEFSVLLEVPFAVTAARMAVRDGSSADPEHPGMRRYVEAQRIYAAVRAPRSRADLVIDNSDLVAPRIVLARQ